VKITAKDAEGVLPDIVLGNDGAEQWIIDPSPLPSERRKGQLTPLFRGAHPFAWARKNGVTSFSWTVSRNHANGDEAGKFSRRHSGDVPANVTLVVEDGGFADSYTGMILDVTAVDRIGRETVFRYTIDGAVLQAPVADS